MSITASMSVAIIDRMWISSFTTRSLANSPVGRIAVDLCIGAAKVVAVEQQNVREVARLDARNCKGNGVGCSWWAGPDELRRGPGLGKQHSSGIIADGDPRRNGMNCGQIRRPGQQFPAVR